MKDFIGDWARDLGFCAVGITTADAVDMAGHLRDAAQSLRIASMRFLARDPDSRCDPKSLLSGAKSVICLAFPYGDCGIELGCSCERGSCDPSRARYARGAGYHKVVFKRLKDLWSSMREKAPNAKAKLCVDTSPILEKALAERAGVGWIGKHTVLINERIGSWFVLGEIITDIEIEADKPARNMCGDCKACIEACPTGAIVAPFELDSGRCISYLTTMVKNKSSGCYGCDVCQEACPYNGRKI